jgi:hypothetical protein
MSINVPEILDQQVSSLVAELDTKGFGCIPNYIPTGDLKRMQSFVSEAIEKSGNEYVHFNGPEKVAGSGLEELASSERFQKLVHDVYERGTGKPAPNDSFYQVLRCLAGNSGQKNSMIFHYDSYVVTALVPIHIPSSGKAGDLLMYPNTRKIRKAYLLNAVDKVLVDNPLSQRLLRASVETNRLSPVRIKMQPGSLYFFWGYRSIHTNEPCDPDKVRATALFHYMNPHKKAS